jgi:NAD(P)-dependent dehydrogenase (short-subunit alcohol dehydrogenase family)
MSDTSPIVLVTGASRGIGRAIAVAFAADRARIALVGRDRAGLDETAALVSRANGDGRVITGDITAATDVERVIRSTVDAFGGIDVLVNNAGIAIIGKIDDFPLADLRRQLEVNVVGAFAMTQAALPWLRKSARAHVFNVGSVCSIETFPEWSAYCASKHALLGFSSALRQEVRGAGIRVTDVLPGATATEIFDALPGNWPKDQMQPASAVGDAVLAAWRAPRAAMIERIQITPSGGAL